MTTFDQGHQGSSPSTSTVGTFALPLERLCAGDFFDEAFEAFEAFDLKLALLVLVFDRELERSFRRDEGPAWAIDVAEAAVVCLDSA